MLAGFRYIRANPVVLGAISLDMFAVLLGGATALLPVFARDVLEVGPWGLGFLRSAAGVGALVMIVWLVRNPIRDHAGKVMFASVAIFAVAIIAFGLSTTLWISLPALFVMGAADMISVNVRQSLIQLATPDDLRGRVTAVNSVFIGASNEVGEFRAGTMAAGHRCGAGGRPRRRRLPWASPLGGRACSRSSTPSESWSETYSAS